MSHTFLIPRIHLSFISRFLSATIFLALIVCAVPYSALRAQWMSDSITNTPVCTASGLQDAPQICSDDSNGAIVVWEDARGNGYRVYAQRLDATGHALWTANGVPLSTGTTDQRSPIVAPDGRGGAYVVWEDWRSYTTHGIDLYSQHITNTGTLAYGTAGAVVCNDPNDQTNPSIVDDGLGNAFVAWEDNRATLTTTRPDLYMNRLTPAAVQWGNDGVALATAVGKQRHVKLVADGTGGGYAAWETSETVPTSIFAQHFDSTGTLHWNIPNGINVFSAGYGTENSSDVSIRRDGNELMLAWETTDITSANQQDLYATRLNKDGSKIYATAIPITGEWYGDQTNPQVYSDDSLETGLYPYPGLLVLFENSYGFTPPQVAMVRMFADGQHRNPPDSSGFYAVSYTSASAAGFQSVRVGTGNVLAVWNDDRLDTCIYAQRVDRDLTRYLPYNAPSARGEAICARGNSKSSEVVLAPCGNGGIAAWTDYRNGNADIYAQLIFEDGTLPLQLSSFDLSAPRVGEVDVTWQTASEEACAGYELERRTLGAASNDFTIIASYETDPALRGAGTSSIAHYYAVRDRTAEPNDYEYRLIDISLDGTRHVSATKEIDAGQATNGDGWALGTNMPNPFATSTVIPITLATDAVIDLTVYDVAGRTIAMPIPHRLLSVGTHLVTLEAPSLGISASGSYLVRMAATDPETGLLLWQSTRPLMIAVVK